MLRLVVLFRTKAKPPWPARTIRTPEPENIAIVRAALIKSPKRSVRKHAQELNMNRDFVRKVLRQDLKFRPGSKLQIAGSPGTENDWTRKTSELSSA